MILDACDCVRDSKHTKRTCDFVKAIDGDSGNLNTSQHLSGEASRCKYGSSVDVFGFGVTQCDTRDPRSQTSSQCDFLQFRHQRVREEWPMATCFVTPPRHGTAEGSGKSHYLQCSNWFLCQMWPVAACWTFTEGIAAGSWSHFIQLHLERLYLDTLEKGLAVVSWNQDHWDLQKILPILPISGLWPPESWWDHICPGHKCRFPRWKVATGAGLPWEFAIWWPSWQC